MGLDVTEICFGNMGRILEKWRDLHAGLMDHGGESNEMMSEKMSV